MQSLTVERKVHFSRGKRARKVIKDGPSPEPTPVPEGTIPRISRLMALAIRFDQLIREGVVADQAELARLGDVTRARLTQIMNLLNLAPDIQEEIMFLPRTGRGRDPITEKHLRPVAAVLDWRKQRARWRKAAKDRPRRATRQIIASCLEKGVYGRSGLW